MKDRFVSSVSHELRTPLTSMVGYLEILSDGEVGELGPEQEHVVEIIARNCDRLNSLIGDILVAARLDSGLVKLEKSSIDLAQLASNQIESIQAVAVAKALDMQLVVHSRPLTIRGDETRLGSATSTTCCPTPSSSRLTAARSRSALGRHDTIAWLEVNDTGIGMPADEVGKVFDRFYRTSTASTIQGTGLGLWIAKSIAEAHGGSLTVSSELGVARPSGSNCRCPSLTIRRVRHPNPGGSDMTESALPAPEPDERDKPVVLAADDDADILGLITFRLERSGYTVLQAHDGEEAFELAPTAKPETSRYSTSMMPKLDGFELAGDSEQRRRPDACRSSCSPPEHRNRTCRRASRRVLTTTSANPSARRSCERGCSRSSGGVDPMPPIVVVRFCACGSRTCCSSSRS